MNITILIAPNGSPLAKSIVEQALKTIPKSFKQALPKIEISVRDITGTRDKTAIDIKVPSKNIRTMHKRNWTIDACADAKGGPWEIRINFNTGPFEPDDEHFLKRDVIAAVFEVALHNKNFKSATNTAYAKSKLKNQYHVHTLLVEELPSIILGRITGFTEHRRMEIGYFLRILSDELLIQAA